MDVNVGTFNLNNLFSRFNFQADLDTGSSSTVSVSSSMGGASATSGLTAAGGEANESTAVYTFGDGSLIVRREYRGRLVKGKSETETKKIAQRILDSNVTVLAVQEVEDVVTLRAFVQDFLNNSYPYSVLIEGNDPRLIDLAVLSRLPLGPATSWQWATHPEAPGDPVFSRDLLEVEVLNARGTARLFTIYNNHLKSQYVPFDQDQVAGTEAANTRRRQQAETVARIIAARQRPRSRYVVVGDLNEPPDSPRLAAIAASPSLGLVNGLATPRETRPAPRDTPPPPGPSWTHRFKPTGQPAHYELFDQIWLSPALAERQTEGVIDRRTRLTGDGTDHDLAWVTLRL